VQIEVEGGELDVGGDDFADPPWIKDERVVTGQASATLAPEFAPEIAPCSGWTFSCRKVK